MARWSFPGVVRLPGERGRSEFSYSPTYEWAARVIWEAITEEDARPAPSVPGHLLWRIVFVEIKRAPSVWWKQRVSRWSFPGVSRARGDRAHSVFSNWFTYKWVARVSWQGRGGALVS